MSLSLFFIFVVLTLGFPCECRKAEHKKNQPRFVQSKNDKRKGDIGDIPFWEEVDAVINHPKNVLKARSRPKRFLHFPKGGSLTIETELTIEDYKDDWHTVEILLGLPLTLELPKGKLQLSEMKGLPTTKTPTYGRNKRDDGQNNEKAKRTLGSQRVKGFKIIQQFLDNLGFPGRICLLRAVCEAAEEPLEAYGIIGDIFNMFFSPGYSKESEDMTEFLNAEYKGLNSSCHSSFGECPFHLIDFIQHGVTFLDSGITSASMYQQFRSLNL